MENRNGNQNTNARYRTESASQTRRPQNPRTQRPARRPQSMEGLTDAQRKEMILESKRKAELARRRKQKAELARKRRRRARICRLILLVVLLVVIFGVIQFIDPVKNKVYVEINGGTVTGEDFQKLSFIKCSIAAGESEIDYTRLGEYPVTVKAMGISHKATVIVRDTTPPEGTVQNLTHAANNEIDPNDFFVSITDETAVTASYGKAPDFTKDGEQTVSLLLTDEAGNKTSFTATLTLFSDTEPPVISGVQDITVYLGDSISYKEGITVTDNSGEDIALQVDNSGVNLNEAGSYPIVYSATDSAGNTATAQATLTLEEKPEGYVEPDVVLEMANRILDEILTDDMSEGEILRAIWQWSRYQIAYTQSDYKESWTGGAYIGFTQRAGDCYIFFSTTKALLTAAGFENIDVVKQDTTRSHHYWNLVKTEQGWYHLDTTNFASGALFCLVTDAELDAYSDAHDASHNRDKSLYPATPDVDYVF